MGFRAPREPLAWRVLNGTNPEEGQFATFYQGNHRNFPDVVFMEEASPAMSLRTKGLVIELQPAPLTIDNLYCAGARAFNDA